MNFVYFLCVIFSAQNVLIPPDQNLSKLLDQNVLILFLSNMLWEYSNIVAQNGIHEGFIQFKIFMNFVNFSCMNF